MRRSTVLVTNYRYESRRLTHPLRVASVCDLHDGPYEPLLARLHQEKPTLVAVPGDFVDRADRTARGLAFLRAVARRFPTFVSLGNHETRAGLSGLLPALAQTGAELLDDRYVRFGDLTVGGLTSGWREGMTQHRLGETPPPSTAFIESFKRAGGLRLLLCHHPEYYPRYLKDSGIELILAGHAHGGQWRLFGCGVFAPGQGFFPRYTAGFYDRRMLVSRGLCRTHRFIPRLFNPRELAILDLIPAAARERA